MEQTQKEKTSRPYSPEFRERAVRLLTDHRYEYQSEAAALTAIAGKLGCSPDSHRVWMRQVQRDGGERAGQTTAEKLRSEPLKAPLVRAQWRATSAMCPHGQGQSTLSLARVSRTSGVPMAR